MSAHLLLSSSSLLFHPARLGELIRFRCGAHLGWLSSCPHRVLVPPLGASRVRRGCLCDPALLSLEPHNEQSSLELDDANEL